MTEFPCPTFVCTSYVCMYVCRYYVGMSSMYALRPLPRDFPFFSFIFFYFPSLLSSYFWMEFHRSRSKRPCPYTMSTAELIRGPTARPPSLQSSHPRQLGESV
ncbi:hypothetical protein F4809DRAFT_590398 [Biscogniauxia mediterranea]|nr:hypothetical protein F4809DRAFT_590398 [Biscogniauxia mediterranea]